MAVHIHSTLDLLELHDLFQYIQDSDPGAVGAGKNWLDVTDPDAPIWYRRNDADDDWILMLTGNASAVGGTTLIGAFGSRPAAGNLGSVYVSTDGPMQSYDNGSTWVNYIDGVPLTIPVSGDFSNLNMTGGATDAAYGPYRVLAGSQQNGSNTVVRERVLTDTSFTLIAKFRLRNLLSSSDEHRAGIYIRYNAATTNAGHLYGVQAAVGGYKFTGLSQGDITASGTGVTGVFADIAREHQPLIAIKLVGNGTDLVPYRSVDGGRTWDDWGTFALNGFPNSGGNPPDRIGYGIYTVGTSASTPAPRPSMILQSWEYTP